MKIKYLPVILGIAALLLLSCEESNSSSSGGGQFPSTPQYKTFRAQDGRDDSFYNVQAQLLYEGTNCNIWGEVASNVDPNIAKNMANTYDNSIFPKMINAFNAGVNFTEGGKVVARNPMELADYFGDMDGKLCILLLDIKDNYGVGGNYSYVAGYFYPIDIFSKTAFANSNECDMIYIDVNPGVPGSEQVHNTLAHEMQHLMNFSLSYAGRSNIMDTWIDEGLANVSEWIWNGKHNVDRIDWYIEDPCGTIKQGNNFYVWDNYTSSNESIILDDYSTVYLFFNWLRLQAGGMDIYKNIIYSTYYDYRAVTVAANAAMSGKGYSNWGTLLKTWLAANYINAPSGSYGYRNDSAFAQIQGKILSGSGSFNLSPGEGIYTTKKTMPSATSNIKYAGLPVKGSTLAPDDTDASGSSALLSYNVDTNVNGSFSPSSPFSVETTFSKELDYMNTISPNLGQQLLMRPYPISMRDMLSRNGHEDNFDFSQLRRVIKFNE